LFFFLIINITLQNTKFDFFQENLCESKITHLIQFINCFVSCNKHNNI